MGLERVMHFLFCVVFVAWSPFYLLPQLTLGNPKQGERDVQPKLSISKREYFCV